MNEKIAFENLTPTWLGSQIFIFMQINSSVRSLNYRFIAWGLRNLQLAPKIFERGIYLTTESWQLTKAQSLRSQMSPSLSSKKLEPELNNRFKIFCGAPHRKGKDYSSKDFK